MQIKVKKPSDDIVVGCYFSESTMGVQDIRNVRRLGKERVVLDAVLQDVDTLNRNNRIYRKAAVEGAIASPYIQEKLRTNSLLGEANHPPSDASLARRRMVDINNVSHVIKTLSWEGNILRGTVESAGTRVGRDWAGLILENGMIGSFSMRGHGEYRTHKTHVEVTGPIHITTWDAVQYPSHQAAYVRSQLDEASFRDIRVSELAGYLAEMNCSDRGELEESGILLAGDKIDYSIEEGHIIMRAKGTGQLLAAERLRSELNEEYINTVRGMFGDFLG